MMHPRSMPCARAQSGVSLIEVMISVAIALFLLAGILVIFSSTSKSFKNQGDLAALQDTERVSMGMLANVIQAAGYYPNPLALTATTALPVDTNYGFLTAGQSIVGTSPGGSLDTITVRYLEAALVAASPAVPASGAVPASAAVAASFDFLMDCNGNSNTTTSALYVVNQFAVNARKQLTCSVNGGVALVLAENVSGLSVLYGVGADSVSQYISASDMTSANWPAVISVKITVILVNPLAGLPGQAATIPFTRIVSQMSKS